jgi:hypothetical protein
VGARSNKNPIIDLHDAGEGAAASFFGSAGRASLTGGQGWSGDNYFQFLISQVAQLKKVAGVRDASSVQEGSWWMLRKNSCPGRPGRCFSTVPAAESERATPSRVTQ